MDGLEVKVRLGTVWKQSLTELSGGQRYVPSLPPLTMVINARTAHSLRSR